MGLRARWRFIVMRFSSGARVPRTNRIWISHRISLFRADTPSFGFDQGKYWIEDLGSTLGVLVNGLKKPKCQVTIGDLIDIGRTRLQLLPTRMDDLISE